MTLDFEKYAMKGNEFLHLLETKLGSPDRAHASRVLRSTLHVLRNHMTMEENLQLLSQLPMAIKSVYVEGWKKGPHKKLKSIEDFLIEIIEEEGNTAWRDFSNREEILDAVRGVVNTLREYVSPGEMEQALATLPGKVRAIFEVPAEKPFK